MVPHSMTENPPQLSLHNTRICEALTSTPPHPHKTVGPIYAVAAFVGEDDVLPLSVPPLSMQNSPVVSCNAVSLCEVDDSSDGRPSDDVLPWCGKRAGCGFPPSAGLLWWLVGNRSRMRVRTMLRSWRCDVTLGRPLRGRSTTLLFCRNRSVKIGNRH